MLTAALAVAYLIAAPPSTDLSAAGYRSDLFTRAGFTLWDNGWYGGHHLLAYSVLAPALGSLLGPQLLAALSMTLAAALFGMLVGERSGSRAMRIAAVWFAFGAGISLLANRVPFDLGLAIGIGALVAGRPPAGAGRRALALVLAALCGLASPIAGVFLALATITWALAGRSSFARPSIGRPKLWSFPLTLTLASLVPIALLAIAFPEGGTQPFTGSAFYPVLAGVLLIAALAPPAERMLRTGVLLYVIALIGAYVIPTAVGGNVDRLGALMAGPIAACALAGSSGSRLVWRAWLLALFAPLLIFWQVDAPIADYQAAASDPAARAPYYTPLIAELRRLGVGFGARPARVEVVPTRTHAEARWVAAHVMLARGWERQLDTFRNGLFYEEAPLRADLYEDWLSYVAVSYVALPDAPLDYSANAEAQIVRGRPGYLREIWHTAHWRLFEVLGATPLAQPPSVLSSLDSDSFTLHASSPGTFKVRLHYTPYWALANGHGCVHRAPGDWTDVQTSAAGSVRVVIDFSLSRILHHGPRCR
jgi:hypothetical protein